jgi:hypothetical protein
MVVMGNTAALERQVHRNLEPFFQICGIPTSDAARASIADLPAWMPYELPASAAR